MDAVAERSLPARQEALACAGVTALVALCLHLVTPEPGDAAAHLYRTFLVRHGVLVWDNLWFAGQYPLASYSLLYYVPAAIFGNLPLVFGAAVASTLLFASIAKREWGDAAFWPTRAFGVLAAAPLFTGLYSYSLGFTAMLGALRAFQSRRTLIGLVLAALALGCSPLAFVFLCLVLASFTLGRSRDWRRVTVVVGGLGAVAAVEAVAMVLFRSNGVYPFHAIALVAVEGVSILGVFVARRARGGRPLMWLFALWGAGAIVWFVVPSPLGDNWTRLNAFLFPLMLLAAALARFRPRRLVLFALAAALTYNIVPYLLLIPYRLDTRPTKEAFWRPAVDFLHGRLGAGYRVESVPTAAHWESYWLPRLGVPLARGFYDQIDAVDDPAVYRPEVDPAAYARWLHALSVEYVLLPAGELDRAGGQGEARLLRSGRTGLPVVFHDSTWTIYRVPHPTPLLTGPGRATVTRLGHVEVDGRVSKPGTYLLRVRYARDLVLHGTGCVRPGPGTMTWLSLSAAGAFRLRAIESPAAALQRVVTAPGC